LRDVFVRRRGGSRSHGSSRGRGRAVFSFLAGGVFLNVLKEELPEERTSTFWASTNGAVMYSGVLLAT